MNKKIKRGLILILACAMLFGAAVACGKKDVQTEIMQRGIDEVSNRTGIRLP